MGNMIFNIFGKTEAGLSAYDSLKEFVEFAKAWESGEWEPQGVFSIPFENVIDDVKGE